MAGNIALTDEDKRIQAEEAARQQALLDRQNEAARAAGPGTIAITSPEQHGAAAASQMRAVDVEANRQATRAGVETADTNVQAGGVAGIFGGRDTAKMYTSGGVQDTTTAGHQEALGARLAGVEGRTPQTMQAAQIGPGGVMQAAQLGPAAQAQAAQMRAAQLGPAATIASGPQDQFRAQQMNLAQMLGAGAAGQGPSAAQAQLKLATDRNMSGALAMALGARGGNQAAAMKQAQMQRALIGQEAGAQSAALAAQEQQAAQQSLGQVLAGGRGADIGMATDQAGLAQQAMLQQGQFQQQALANNQQAQMQAELANQGALQQTALAQGDLTQGANAANQQAAIQQAQLQQQANAANLQSGVDQQAQKDALINQLMGQGMQLDEAKRQADIQQAQFNADLLARQSAANKGISMQSQAGAGNALGQAAQAAGTIIATGVKASDRRVKWDIRPGEKRLGELLSSTSDERAKEEIRPATKPLGELLGAVGAHDYRYKDPGKPLRGEGRFVSPMAQEIEKTEIGRSMVRDTPDGKVVDYGKGLGAMLSGLGWVHRRLEQIEEKLPLGARLAGAR